MAQIVTNNPGWGSIIGEGLGQGTVATLQKLIDEKARKIEEKHEYERNLKFLKGAGYKNAEQLAHGSSDQLQQLLKSNGSQGSSASPAGNSQYDQLLQQYDSMGQGQQQGEGDQELEQVLQGEPTPEGYSNPKVQQALMKYLQTPEAQQEYTPEQIQYAQQKLQKYAQQGGQPSPKQQLMGQAPQQSAQGGLSSQDKLYDQLLSNVPSKFQYDVLKEKRAIRQPLGDTKDQKLKLAEQKEINKIEKPFKDQIEKQATVLSDTKVILNRMKNTWDSGKVYSGYKGKLIPYEQMNDETQLFLKDAKTLVGLVADQSRGLPTKFRLQFTEEQKPTINMNHNVQGTLLDNLSEDVDRKLKVIDFADQLVLENDNEIPKGFSTNVRKLVKDLDEAPPIPKGAKEGDEGHDEYGQLWRIVNGKMKKIEER